MNGLLYWLSREKNIESAIERLMNSIPMKDRNLVRSKLVAAIDMYKLESSNVANECKNNANLSQVIDVFFEDEDLSNGLSESFLNCYKDCSFPSWLLDVILHEQIYLPSQVEDRENPSSHVFAEDILRSICEITLSFKKENETNQDEHAIKLIGRDRNKCATQVLICNPYRFKFANLEIIESKDSQQLLLNLLKVQQRQYDVIINCDSRIKLLLICINFWCSIKKSNVIAPNQSEVGAIIALIAIYSSGFISKEKLDDEKRDKIRQLFVPNHDLKCNRKMFDIEIVQVFANLQTTVMYTIVVNRLLKLPIEEPEIHKMWNCTFLYNVASKFETTLELQKYLDLKEFDDYLKICAAFIPGFSNLKNKVVQRKRKKVKKRGQKSVDITTNNDHSSEEETNIDSKYHDTCNKFSILDIE